MDLVAGTVVERYTVEARLGSGGMAVVYLVRHNQLGSLHAMKVLSLPSAAIRRRLREEGRAQGQVRHPNVVAVTDLVDVDGCPALVMEYVAGPSLADLLSDQRPTFAQADDLARGILQGVEAAHRGGLVHRDLKPGNVLLSMESGVPVPKIADFGLAKAVGPEVVQGHTRSGATLGTPAYMAPEQIRDAKSVDHRADLFSLGALLYEIVTGTRAFTASDTLELLKTVADARYRPVRELRSDVPKRMEEAIERALVVDADARVQDCSALLSLWTGKERRVWPQDAWDQQAMFRMATLQPTRAELQAPPPDLELPTFVLGLEDESYDVDGVPFRAVAVEPGTVETEPGRTVEVYQRLLLSPEPLHAALAAALGLSFPDGACWEDAAVWCNQLSERTGLPAAYSIGPLTPRRAYTIDDVGRALYDLVPFERLGGILKAFGTSALDVLVHTPERLAEVEGIGAKTAARIAQQYDAAITHGRTVERIAGATGWRLPTEAEWVLCSGSFASVARWEWVADADPGPPFLERATPLPTGAFVDPAGHAEGALRIVRSRTARGVRPTWARATDLGFHVVRSAPE